MKTHSKKLALALLALALAASARAQVNSGSTGADGAFNPTTNTVINMADHPDGIYHYTSVNVPAGVTVKFIPNSNNSSVVWLVQGNCVVSGTISVSGGQVLTTGIPGEGGPGGYRGGNGGAFASNGQGPGGGASAPERGGSGSYASLGQTVFGHTNGAGATYGNQFIVPLVGGSGGGGAADGPGAGGGGGGALMIVSSAEIQLMGGALLAEGGSPGNFANRFTGSGSVIGGYGSGGSVRLIASRIFGTGAILTTGRSDSAGLGRVRFDTPDNSFGGTVRGSSSQGFQPIILPAAGQGVQLTVQSVSGVPVATSPNGMQATPDVIIGGQQSNPVAIVVRCTNLPLGTPVTVTVKPANGASVSAVGYNNSGTLASSTATVSLNMPRGGGLIYATAATAP